MRFSRAARLALLALLCCRLGWVGGTDSALFACEPDRDGDGVACAQSSDLARGRSFVYRRRELERFSLFLDRSQRELCKIEGLCRVHILNALVDAVLKAEGSLPHPNALRQVMVVGTRLLDHQFSKIILANSRRTDLLIEPRHSYADLSLDQLGWHRDESLTIALTNDAPCTHVSALNMYVYTLTSRLLPLIRTELPELQVYLSRIVVAFAFSATPDLLVHLPQACELVRNALADPQSAYRPAVFCTAFGVAPSPHHDIRDALTREAHAQIPTDHYLWLDSRVVPVGPAWISAALASQWTAAQVTPGPAANFLSCAWQASLTKSPHVDRYFTRLVGGLPDGTVDHDLSSLLQHPTSPLLRADYLRAFPTSPLLNPAPPGLNTLLLMDVYRAGSAAHCYDHDGEIAPLAAADLLLPLADLMEPYRRALPDLRRRLLDYISRELYPVNPVHLENVELEMQPGDALWWHLCADWLGDCATFSSFWRQARWETGAPLPAPANFVEVNPRSDATAAVSGGILLMPIRRFNAPGAHVAAITAIYGAYEASCKPFARQSIPVDFFCFTDAEGVRNENRGWIVDTTPHHLVRAGEHPQRVNSQRANQHPFNIAKFYKTSFHRIPALRGYDHVIWLDGSLQVVDRFMAERVVNRSRDGGTLASVMVFAHPIRLHLWEEVLASLDTKKYTVTEWAGYQQPYQDVVAQFRHYQDNLGYSHEYWAAWNRTDFHGVWCTCFLAFNMRDPRVEPLLEEWHEHVQKLTTQDQVSFPMVVQRQRMPVYTFPDHEVVGSSDRNTMFIKHPHGR